jgi:hypothetical protein
MDFPSLLSPIALFILRWLLDALIFIIIGVIGWHILLRVNHPGIRAASRRLALEALRDEIIARKVGDREEVRAWFLDCIQDMDVGTGESGENEGKWWPRNDVEAQGGGVVAGWIDWGMRLWRGW